MKILQVKDQQAGGRAGYDVFAEAVKNGAHVFGLATGSTPISIYDELKASDLDFSDKISINLDEYKGPCTHPSWLKSYLRSPSR